MRNEVVFESEKKKLRIQKYPDKRGPKKARRRQRLRERNINNRFNQQKPWAFSIYQEIPEIPVGM